MQFRGLTTTLTVLAATVGLGAAASGAQAAAVVSPPVIDNDGFLLTGTTELALSGGNVAFSFSNGTITPRVTATLKGEKADDLCVRARIDSYEGATLLHSKHGKKTCLKNDKPYAVAVDFSEAADARTDNVTVAIEKENLQGWTTVDATAPGFLDVNTFADSVLILGLGVDFGGPGYAGGNPTSNAFVSYPLDNGLVTPHVDGYIHVEGFSNCTRIQMLVIGAGPLSPVLETVNGPKHCPADLSHVSFHDVLDGTPTGSVNQVEIILQTKNGGSWLNAGNQTVSIAE